MRLRWMVLFVVLVGAPALSQPVATAIVAGQAIGPVQIGMPMDEAAGIARMYGPVRDENTEDGRRLCNSEPNIGVCVYDYYRYGQDQDPTKTPGRVLAVATDDPRFRLPGGLGVGSAMLDVLRLVGTNPQFVLVEADSEVPVLLEWTSRGLLVGIRQGRAGAEVGFILVFRPRP